MTATKIEKIHNRDILRIELINPEKNLLKQKLRFWIPIAFAIIYLGPIIWVIAQQGIYWNGIYNHPEIYKLGKADDITVISILTNLSSIAFWFICFFFFVSNFDEFTSKRWEGIIFIFILILPVGLAIGGVICWIVIPIIYLIGDSFVYLLPILISLSTISSTFSSFCGIFINVSWISLRSLFFWWR